MPDPSLASSAAMRAFKVSFSSRAVRAISLTASNSSRLTTSRSRRTRSAWLRNIVSNSRRTPDATPAASFMSLAISSKKRLVVWVIACLGFELNRLTTMGTVCLARKGSRHAPLISCKGAALSVAWAARPGRRPYSVRYWQHRQRAPAAALRTSALRPHSGLTALAPCPHHPGLRESPDVALCPPLPRDRPRARQLWADRHPLVCARLHRRHTLGLVLCARDHRARAALAVARAHHRQRLRRFRAVGDARHYPRRAHRLRAVLQSQLFRHTPTGELPTLEGP